MANQNIILKNLISQGIVVAVLHKAQIALDHAQGVLKWNLAAGVGLSDIPKMPLHAERSLPPQLDFIRGDFSSDKFNRFAERYNRCFVVQLQTNIGAQVK